MQEHVGPHNTVPNERQPTKFRVYRPRLNTYFGAMRAIAWSMCVLWWARGGASYVIHVFETS